MTCPAQTLRLVPFALGPFSRVPKRAKSRETPASLNEWIKTAVASCLGLPQILPGRWFL